MVDQTEDQVHQEGKAEDEEDKAKGEEVANPLSRVLDNGLALSVLPMICRHNRFVISPISLAAPHTM